MSSYESPAIIELGSVADFTRRDDFALDWDGRFLRGDDLGGGGGIS